MAESIIRGSLVPGAPQISVVVIAYNNEPFVVEAVTSAVSQDLPDVEVIVVDDGSRNPVAHLLPADVLARCVLITRENGGIAAARNTGIRACRSPYVALLDGDDRMLPQHCRMALECLRANPQVDVVVPDAFIIEEGVEHHSLTYSARYPRTEPISFQKFINGSSPVVAWSTMRRDTFDRFCYYDEEFRTGGEDFHFVAKLLVMGATCRYMSEPTYEYRRHSDSVTIRRPMHMAEQVLRAIEKLESDPDVNANMRMLLAEHRERTTRMLAWNHFRTSFLQRDFAAASKWASKVKFHSLPSHASRIKFVCALLMLKCMRLR